MAGVFSGLPIQLIKGAHLDATYNTLAPNGNKIRIGIEFSRTGKRLAYRLFREHPGRSFLTSGNTAKRIRVPAREILR